MWNERYSNPVYAYGKEPNAFFKEELDKLPPGTLLLPAEGEGRNAIYAVTKGWKVYAFDTAQEGKVKAMKLAAELGVEIEYMVCDADALKLPEQVDVMALIYAHFPAEIKSAVHQKLLKWVKPNGTIIFEAFSKKHLPLVMKNPSVGGPKDIQMLFDIPEIKQDFVTCNFINLEEKEISLNEGIYHNGIGSVIRLVATKNGNHSRSSFLY